jgi:putative hydrolase of the HAD superfamily
MEKLTGVQAAVFASVYDRYRTGFDLGKYDGVQMYSMLMDAEGHHHIARDDGLMKEVARLDMETWQHVDNAVVEWVSAIKKRGFKLGILSNMPTEFLDNYEKDIEPFVIADYACFSCRVKLVKPQPEIYAHTLSKLAVSAEEAVFFDDIQENVDAANQLGIRAFLWTGLEKAKEDLRSVLSRLNKLQAGLTAECQTIVDKTNTASSVGSGLLPVFSTPSMIALMETSAAAAAAPALEEGFSTVGSEINVKHIAATPPGMNVRARSELLSVEGKKLVFAIEAFDDAGKIGEGSHTRYIVENAKFLRRAQEKAAERIAAK